MSGANLFIFEPLIELAMISMHNSLYRSLREIKEEGKSERKREQQIDMFRPASPSNVIWHMALCASFGVGFLLSG